MRRGGADVKGLRAAARGGEGGARSGVQRRELGLCEPDGGRRGVHGEHVSVRLRHLGDGDGAHHAHTNTQWLKELKGLGESENDVGGRGDSVRIHCTTGFWAFVDLSSGHMRQSVRFVVVFC